MNNHYKNPYPLQWSPLATGGKYGAQMEKVKAFIRIRELKKEHKKKD